MKKSEKNNPQTKATSADRSALRKGQVDTIDAILERHETYANSATDEERAANRVFVGMLPTRYGKSDVMRVSSVLLHAAGLADYFIVISPGLRLRRQMGNIKKWSAAQRRYALSNGVVPQELESAPSIHTGVTARFLSVSMQGFHSQAAEWMAWIQHMQHLGRRVVVFVDECHNVGDTRAWGALLHRLLLTTSASVVYLSATPVRHDGERLPGCEDKYESQTEEESYVRTVVTPLGDEMIRIQKWERCERGYQLKPDVMVTYADAWRESPAVMCNISRHLVSATVRNDDSGYSGELDKVPAKLRGKALRAAVRDSEFMRKLLGQMIDDLRKLKHADHRAQAMVFCCNRDQNGSPDEQHVAMVQGILAAMAPEMRVVVANMDEPDSQKILDRFADDAAGDICILKQMAGQGFDAPNVVCVADLSTVRTHNSCVQRWNRGGTLTDTKKVFFLYVPNDVEGAAIFDEMTEGQTVGVKLVTAERLIEEYEKQIEDGPDASDTTVSDPRSAGADDNFGRAVDEAGMRMAKVMYYHPRLSPELVKSGITLAELYQMINAGEPPPDSPAPEPSIDVQAEIEEGLSRSEKMKRYYSKQVHDPTLYASLDNRARDIAGIPRRQKGVKLSAKSFTDLSMARRYPEAMWQAINEDAARRTIGNMLSILKEVERIFRSAASRRASHATESGRAAASQ